MPHELLLKLLSLLCRNKSRKEKKSLVLFISDRSAVKGDAIDAIWVSEHQKSVDITGEITRHLQKRKSKVVSRFLSITHF